MPTELEEQIDARSREIKTDGYAMSIGEMLSMYRDGELDVHPEFQRIYRWTDEQKSSLVESILLGIPVPTIFVAQRLDGIWDVIDGVQRLSTILEFVGLYKSQDGTLMPPLNLNTTEYLPSLDGYQYEVDPGNGRVFPETLRRDFKRSKLDFRIIRKESDPDAKYDLFQRLNSGTQLSPQEARNCLLVMLNPGFYRWMSDLGRTDEFQETVPLSDTKGDQGFADELVLRFFLHVTFTAGTSQLSRDLGEYITDWVREFAKSQEDDLAEYAEQFQRSFALLNAALGDDCFRRYDDVSRRFLGAFSISAYEAITSGIASNLEVWRSLDPSTAPDLLRERLQKMWTTSGFRDNAGTGMNARRRAPRLIHFGREYFATTA